METRGTVIVLVLLGALAMAVVGIGVTTANMQLALVMMAAIALSAIMVLVLRVVQSRRSRRGGKDGSETPAELAALGLMLIPKPGNDLHRHFADLGVVHRSGSIKQAMHGMMGQRRLLIFQHTYHIHTGQASVPVTHTVHATTSPNHWPELRIEPRGFWSQLLLRLGKGRGVEVESGDFNRAFKVTCVDEDFAITLLSPEMQGFLMSEAGERWLLSGGEACIVKRCVLKFDQLGGSVERLRGFWALVPRELEAWGIAV